MAKRQPQPLKKDIFYSEGSNEPILIPEDNTTDAERQQWEKEGKEGRERLEAKIRMNVWVSSENLDFLKFKAEHTGSNVASLCGIAISDYCDDQRVKYKDIYKKLK